MVQWAAGERITASKLSTTRISAACDAGFTPGTSVADISGMTITFTTTRANVVVHAIAVLDAEALTTTPSTGTLVGELLVDGSAQSAQILWNAGVAAASNDDARGPGVQSWLVTLASAGSHTLKMRGSRVGGTASHMRVNAIHSTLTLTVEDSV